MCGIYNYERSIYLLREAMFDEINIGLATWLCKNASWIYVVSNLFKKQHF